MSKNSPPKVKNYKNHLKNEKSPYLLQHADNPVDWYPWSNEAFKKAAQSALKGIVEYTEEPIVSIDIIGNPHSCIIDADSTMVVDGTQLKVIGWYDNEWGYSNRVIDLIVYIGKKGL